MKKNLLKSILFICVFFSSSMVYGQDNMVFMKFGGALPMSDFGDKSFEDVDAGGAMIGAAVGFEYIHQFDDKLGLLFGVDVLWNPMAKSYRDDMEDYFGNPDKVRHFTYLNLPISLGLSLTAPLNNETKFIGSGGLVVNVLKVTNMKVKDDALEEPIEGKFDIATSIGFRIGGGFLLNDKTLLQITYYGLGEHSLTGEAEMGSSSADLEDVFGVDEFKRTISVVALSVGVKF